MVFLKTLNPLRKVIFNYNGTMFIFVSEKPFGKELAVGNEQPCLAVRRICNQIHHSITPLL